MNILINASNLKQGGGIQVANSICMLLDKYPGHHFEVVLSNALASTKAIIEGYSNVSVSTYDIKNTLSSIVFHKDSFLGELVNERHIDVVLTVFGPSRWRPSVPHLCGFARAQILPMDTPYLRRIPLRERILNAVVKRSFKFDSDYYWTENSSVTDLLERVFPKKRVFTISNSYNQVFDDPGKWNYHKLPDFNGATFLTVSNSYYHKNLPIAIKIAEVFQRDYPDFAFRFVFTIDESEFPAVDPNLRHHFEFIGKVDISECPSLYIQSDIMFQPSFLECFSATYPEAMKMGVPIVTTDLAFAHGLCGDAALYYQPLSADEAAKQIYRLANDNLLREQMKEAGYLQLNSFLNAEERCNRLIQILESIA